MATLLQAFETALVGNAQVADVDEAVIETGRIIAKSIDDIIADPAATATDRTKALYLTPHLVAILKELLATPAARKAVGLATTDSKNASRLTLLKGQAAKAAGK